MDRDTGKIGTSIQPNAFAPENALLPGNALFADGPPPKPEPEHQRKITRERWFELAFVIALIVGGTGFLIWRGQSVRVNPGTPTTVEDAAHAAEVYDYVRSEETTVFDQHMVTLRKSMPVYDCTFDVLGSKPDTVVDTMVLALVPRPDDWDPDPEKLQEAVDEIAAIAMVMLPSAGVALKKAVATMESIEGVPRPHYKGVAATSDSWKLSYITYQEFDEQSAGVPVLYLILQRFAAGEDETLAPLNRLLYATMAKGLDIRSELVRASGESAAQPTGSE